MNPWFPAFRRNHTVSVIIGFALAVCAAPFLPSFTLSVQLSVLAAAVVLFGLPHGALDLALVRGASGGSLIAPAVAATIYLILSLSVLALWLTAPIVAILAFLLVAIAHFGLGDTEDLKGFQRATEVVARGGFAVIAPLAFHPQTTLGLFSLLVGADSTARLNDVIAALLPGSIWLWAACLASAVAWRVIARLEGWKIAILELILTVTVFAVFHPLGAFLIYFSFVHSVRHIADLGAARSPNSAAGARRWIATESLPLTAATVVLAALAWWFFAQRFYLDEALIRIIFWGLSALTVPHMMLTAWWHRGGGPKPGDLFSRIS